MSTNYDIKSVSNPETILHIKDNGVFSAWNYSSKNTGGGRRRKLKKSTRGKPKRKIGKGRRTRRTP
jgi:hypothetical protein